MWWGENVPEENKRPDQTKTGSMDPDCCVLLDLTLQLEYAEMLRTENTSTLLFNITKHRISTRLKKLQLKKV